MSAPFRYLGRFWQGRAPLSAVVIALIVVGTATGYAIAALGPDWLALRLTVLTLVVVFLIAGSLRTATRLLNSGTGPQAVWAIYGAIVVLLYLTVLRVVGFFLLESNVTQPIVLRPPKVVVIEGRAEVLGEIDYRTYTELGEILEAHPDLSTVLLNSRGGNVIAGRSIGLLIERNEVDTLVEEECFSACTLIFAGGKNRELGENAKLGFHGYQFDHDQRVQTVEINKVVAEDRAYLERRGIAPTFLDRVYQVSSEEMWIPTREELTAAGMLTTQ
ncbi:MAG: hypothetical protein GY947_04565 [Rhodobacteraceae bacterium]|nr:hypothetical protein [Paracoccaceae bacterium]